MVPPMPPDAFVKVEVVVKEEEGLDGRPKRQRAKRLHKLVPPSIDRNTLPPTLTLTL